MTNNQNLINNTYNELFLINEKLHEPLLHIVNKLLGRQNLNFEPPEQKLWNLFENRDIYEFLTSEKDTRIQTQLDHLQCQA